MNNLPEKSATSSHILLYQTEDGNNRIEVMLENETVWLSQKLMAELFQVMVPTINEHIKNIFNEQELQENSVIRKFRITAAELQARGRKPMYMADWKAKLDVFLTLNDQDILTDVGRASAQLAKDLAESEFEKYQTRQRQIEADTANEELNRTVKRIID
jgi:hypothetical protein